MSYNEHNIPNFSPMSHKVTLILGTAREGRESEKAAKYVQGIMNATEGIECQFIDVRDYAGTATVPSWDEGSELRQKWSDIVTNSDGFVIVAPEYNHSFPGELKILMDKAYKEYDRKPVGICAVSAGGFGGTRMVSSIIPYLTALQTVPLNKSVHFSGVKELFDESGSITDDGMEKKVQGMLEELKWYLESLS